LANKIFNTVSKFIKEYLQKKASLIDHSAITKDIHLEVEISAGYFLILSLANLIALTGLITNSIPVIIGAMLISPLMGPILSSGFAFITGDNFVWKKSLKKISLSVALTIIIAVIATYISPLKDVTNEIMSRTRPNLYDLIIAFLSGTAGAIAICTKKNYLTIVPGVAIATAVIPPLSVAGFGLGIGKFNIFAGGFFLFFTNFVAIIISTCIVFYLYGFKPAAMTEQDISQLRKRVAALAILLFIISIPLVYTLYHSISEVKLRNNVKTALKKAINKERQSEVFKFDYSKEKDGILSINAVINTTSYMKESEIETIEKNIRTSLNSKVKLYLEQIKVQPGGLKEEVGLLPKPAVTQQKSVSDIIRSSRENVITVVRQSSEKIEKIIAPSTISDFSVAFNNRIVGVSIKLQIRRDSRLSGEETEWLKKMFAADLNLPVDLSVETLPFVPLLAFEKGETSLTDEIKKALIPVKDAYMKVNSIFIKIEAYPESSLSYQKRMKVAEQRINNITTVLTHEYKIPESQIKTVTVKKAVKKPAVKIIISTAG
jgi:uncharacterized hydrophobic protein (TIGR00271 family)